MYKRQIKYHDEEWCQPQFDDKYLLEMLILESFQAGLSWECVLKDVYKRQGLNRYYKEILKFSDDEIQYQFNNWIGYVMEHTPSAFNGIREILWKFKENRRTHLRCV